MYGMPPLKRSSPSSHAVKLFTRLDGSFYIEGPGTGFIEDISILVNILVYMPLLMTAVALTFPRLSRVLDELQFAIEKAAPSSTTDDSQAPVSGEGRPRLSEDCYRKILKKRADTILMGKGNKSRYLAAILFLIGFLWVISVSVGIAYTVDDDWVSTTYLMSYVAHTLYITVFYGIITPFLAFKLITILHAMRSICFKLTKDEVLRVRPLNPDKAGGLGAIGTFSFQLVLVMLVPLVPILTRIMLGTTSPITFVNVSMYVPVLVLTFFYPLGGAHRAMQTAKQNTLRTLSEEFNRIHDDFMGRIRDKSDTKEPAGMKEQFEMAEKVGKLYMEAQQMPVWPFNLTTLSRFGGILLTSFSHCVA